MTYSSGISQILKIRNTVAQDYYNFKLELREKKNKLFTNSKDKIDFDPITIKFSCIDKSSEEFTKHRNKFILSEVQSK